MIASLKLRRKELELTGQADSQAVKDIDAKIQRLEDERELQSLTADAIAAKGRVQEFETKKTEEAIDTDREVTAALLDRAAAAGADVSVEREASGIYPVVTQQMKDQAEAARLNTEKIAAMGPAAQTSAGQVEEATGRMAVAINDPNQALLDLLRHEGELGPTVLRQGGFFQRFAAMANAALDSIRIAQLAAAIEAANRALSVLGMRLPVPSAAAPEGRQFGGPVAAGRPMWVGETQPEIWIPRSPGVVARPQQLQLGGAGFGSTYAPAFNVHGSTMEEMRAAFHRSIEDFFRRANAGAVGAGNSIYSGVG